MKTRACIKVGAKNIDIAEMTDDELRRKVQELMGYGVEFETETYDDYGGTISYYALRLNGEDASVVGDTEDEVWQQAPDPLTDANVYMALVDEMRTIGKTCGKAIRIMDCIGDSWFFVFGDLATTIYDMTSQSNNLGRAICEVYCQVKEQK